MRVQTHLNRVFDRTVDSSLRKVIFPRTEFENLMRSFQIPWYFADVLSHTDPIFANFVPWHLKRQSKDRAVLD
jgi:hypothetical protein